MGDLIIPFDRSSATHWSVTRTIEKRERHALLTASSASYFAVITLRVEPGPLPDAVVFRSAVVDDPDVFDALPVWVEGVASGVVAFLQARQERGEPLAGVTITLTELQEHPVDSKKMAYHRAAVRALTAACDQPDALQQLPEGSAAD